MNWANWAKRLLISALLLFVILTGAVSATWWDEAWTNRQPINITNTAGELTDYQVKINLNGSNTEAYFNWSNNGADLRFIDNSQTELNYWIEEWDENKKKAVVWIKAPLLKNNTTTTIYMYYGNPTATSRSNGTATFEFYDFIEDNNIDSWNLSGWGQYDGDAIAENQQMRLSVYKCFNIEALKNIGNYNSNLAFKFHWKTKADQWYEIPRWNVLVNNTKVSKTIIDGTDVKSPGYRGTKEGEVEAVANTKGEVKLLFRIYQSRYCSYGDHKNTYFWVDNISVRKYISPEPLVEIDNKTLKQSELSIPSEYINLLKDSPVLEDNLPISSVIKNTGNKCANNVTVQFFDGDPCNGTLIGEQKIGSIGPGEEVVTRTNWTVEEAGTQEIYVIVDPYNNIAEQNESNNIAHRSVNILACPQNPQQELLEGLNSQFAGHGYDFYEEYYAYDDNATVPDPIKTCYTDLDDDDTWMYHYSSESPGIYPCSVYLFGPRIGVDTNNWYDSRIAVRGYHYPELELEIIDEWVHNKPLVGRNEDVEVFLEHLLETNKCGFESGGVYSQGTITYDNETNKSVIITKFNGEFFKPGGYVGEGKCQAEFNKYYDADTEQFGDDLKDLSCTADFNIPIREAGYRKNTSHSFGLVKFDGEVEAGVRIDPSARGGLRLDFEPRCLLPAGNIDAGIGLNAKAQGKLCIPTRCYNIESSLPIPEISGVEVLGEAVIPNENFGSSESLTSMYPNPGGDYVTYKGLKDLNPVFRVATSEIDVEYQMDFNLKDLGICCSNSEPFLPPCNLTFYEGSLVHIDPWQAYWGFTEITVHSPVDVHVYDSLGRHIGINSSTNSSRAIELEIPNSTYEENNNTKTIKFPTTVEKFIVLLEGTDSGNYTLNISRPIMVERVGNSTLKGVAYSFENVSTFNQKKDFYSVDFIEIERNVNKMVGNGMNTDKAVDKGFNLIDCTLNATRSPSSINLHDYATYYGENASLRATLMSFNNPLVNRTVFFTLDGEIIGADATDSDGKATLEFPLNNTDIGTHEIKCIFNGSEEHYRSTGYANLRVLDKSPETSINVTDYPSGRVWINGTINDNNLANITLKIDNNTVSNSIPYFWNTGEYRNGYHHIKMIATDDSGKKAAAIAYVFVHNPVADAGGPYEGLEGSPVLFNGSDSYDSYDKITRWLWDMDEDGIGELNATANKGVVSYEWGDNQAINVTLQVMDSSGGTDIDTTRLNIHNVAPEVEAGKMQEVTAGDIVNFNGSFSDPGWLDEHNLEWDFGDGHTFTQNLSPTHIYYNKGSYNVNLSVEDDDGGIGRDATEIVVKPIPADIRIAPEVLKQSKGRSKGEVEGKLTVFITLPQEYNISNTDPGSITCNNATPRWVKTADSKFIIAKFEREDLENLDIAAGGEVNLTLEGKVLHNGGYAEFEGNDTVTVKRLAKKSKGKS